MPLPQEHGTQDDTGGAEHGGKGVDRVGEFNRAETVK
jgi:hypothetical protein